MLTFLVKHYEGAQPFEKTGVEVAALRQLCADAAAFPYVQLAADCRSLDRRTKELEAAAAEATSSLAGEDKDGRKGEAVQEGEEEGGDVYTSVLCELAQTHSELTGQLAEQLTKAEDAMTACLGHFAERANVREREPLICL